MRLQQRGELDGVRSQINSWDCVKSIGISLEFVGKKDLDIFCDALDRGEIRLASEVKFAIRQHISI